MKTPKKTTASTETTSSRKYITLESGVDFRKIAEVMTQAGYQMNHATARNQLMIALTKLLDDVAKQAGAKLSKAQLSKLLQNQTVHNALADILHVVHEEDQAGKRK